MSDKTELEILEEQKVELINDLAATVTVMEEMWRYHPDNPSKVDIVKEYNTLLQIQKDIEKRNPGFRYLVIFITKHYYVHLQSKM